MLLAIDVHYKSEGAQIGGVLFSHWTDQQSEQEIVTEMSAVVGYVPGQFYRRELPCILKLLDELAQLPAVIIIDGNVFLDGYSQPGLGAHLYEALDSRVQVVGIAKTKFAKLPVGTEVFRGKSKKLVYVTAIGADLEESKKNVRSMYGDFRIPALVKRADKLSRM